ncbi:serine/threonine-protein kinase/endoribonuclease IRE1-like [Clarias gariepinus]|uniref:serine/threonine-protein kinase/endoribonuclease IRE1-like n=1 Tax=Clarias gariepinus TaxID=13013 RepID=UPI00234D1DFE|nr:serine/threonine-protein kinase/endoribonuclease IRE1-like [Clarias gariepinus]
MSAPSETTPQDYNALSLSVEESGHPIVKPIIFEFDALQLQIFHKDKFDEHVLHHGKSSELLRGQMKDGTEVVIKKRPVSEISSSRSEAKILREIKHCGIVGYICFHEDDEFTYLVLDLVESTLEEHIEQINSLLTDEDEKKAKLKELTVKVLQALNFLHQEQYIHGDVKLRNVRVDKVKPKLIDFTLSEKMTDRNVQKMKDEIHKAGVLAYYILSGGKNYSGLNTEFAVSDLEWDFIEGMTEKKQSLKKALDHPVFWKDYRKLKYLEGLSNLKL